MSKKKKKHKKGGGAGKADRLSRQFLDAALEFHRLRPWDRISTGGAFLLEVPTESHPMIASIMGDADREYGLGLQRGASAASHFLRILEGEDPRDIARDASVLSVTFGPMGTVPLEFRGLLDAARFIPRSGQAVPLAISAGPDKPGAPPTRAELRSLVYALEGVIKALESGILDPAPFDPNAPGILAISVTGDIQDIEVEARNAPMPDFGNGGGPTAPKELFQGLESLPRKVASWALGSVVFPADTSDDDHSMQVLVLVDEAQEKALAFEVIPGDAKRGAAEALAAMLEGRHGDLQPGVPARLSISPFRLYRYLAPALEAHGVRCTPGMDDDLMSKVIDGLSEAFFSRGRTEKNGGEEGLEPLEPWDMSITPKDLEEWQQASDTIGSTLLVGFDRDMPGIETAIDLYFGQTEVIDDLLDDDAPLEAFCEWHIAAYRPEKTSSTWIEDQIGIDRNLSEAERVLYEARARGEVSIYRLAGKESNGSFDATCMFTGRVRRIHPSPVSYIRPDGSFAPLRLVSVGEWIVPVVAGPALPPETIQEAIEYLQKLAGEPVSQELLSRSPHLLGRLWAWEEPPEQDPPVLTNTDGHLFAPQVQTYKSSSPKSLKRYLARQPDMEWDPDEGCFIWFREKEGSRLGERTLLARIKQQGNHWQVSVNSDERAESIRNRIESVAGVRLVSSREDDAQYPALPFGQSPPLKSPEDASLINDFFHDYYLAWLDEPLPMLQGRTVREISRSPGGEHEARALIESIEAPPGVQIPRDEMLRSLGLGP